MMQNSVDKDSYQTSAVTTSTCLPFWWNATAAPVPQVPFVRAFNLNIESPKQKDNLSKGSGLHLKEPDSSSSQLTDESHLDVQGYVHANGKRVCSGVKSLFSLSTPEYGFIPTQMDHTSAHQFIAYPHGDPYFGGTISAHGSPLEVQQYAFGMSHGRVPLPYSLAADGPIFVNAKQYRGILRRRLSRAKLESQNKLIKARKPYLHESRHLHAMKRARGSGGRFLNTKMEAEKGSAVQKLAVGVALQLGNFSDSEVLHSENGFANSGNSGSAASSSEVSSSPSHDHLFQRSDFLFPGFLSHTGGVTQTAKPTVGIDWPTSDGSADKRWFLAGDFGGDETRGSLVVLASQPFKPNVTRFFSKW